MREPARRVTEKPFVRRDPPLQQQTLAPQTVAWIESLPADMRPSELCSHHPAVANKVALCWSDRELGQRMLDDLLICRREDRHGFARVVATELLKPRELHSQIFSDREGPLSQWEPASIVPSDRLASSDRKRAVE